jgi:RNA recognition motif-containing protein
MGHINLGLRLEDITMEDVQFFYHKANVHSGGGSNHHPAMPGYTKIYIGQLPLNITEEDIEEVFR